MIEHKHDEHETFKDFFFNETKEDVRRVLCLENDEHVKLLSLLKRRSTIYLNNRNEEQLHRLFNTAIECVRQFESESIYDGIMEYFEREKQIEVVCGILHEVLERLDRPVRCFDSDNMENRITEDMESLERQGKIDPKC